MSLTITVTVRDAAGASASATTTADVSTSGAVPMPALTTGAGLAQRPVFSASTNVLSWQGPVGGGPSNGDYTLQSRVLTPRGAVSSTGPNTVIEGLNISGNPAITINHNNVTVRQNRVVNQPSSGAYNIWIAAGVTGTVIEDNLLDANGANTANADESNNISGPNLAVTGVTIRRNTALNTAQMVRFTLNNLSSTENYVSKISGADADMLGEVYPNGGVCDNLEFRYNYIDGSDNAIQGVNSGINLSTGAGLPGGTIGPNVVIDSNWFVWKSTTQNVAWQSHAICNGVGGATGGNSERLSFQCTNNGIYNAGGSYGSSTLLGTPSSGSATIDGGLIRDSGNYVMATPTSRTGTPYPGINGPGRL